MQVTNHSGNSRELAERTLWLINEYIAINRQPKTYGTGEQFHMLDIHLVHLIGSSGEKNASSIAQRLGISRAAVSQAARKLEARGLIERYKTPENRKEVLFRLTCKGRTAFDAHTRFHESIDVPFLNEIEALSPEERTGAECFLDILERRANRVRAAHATHQNTTKE